MTNYPIAASAAGSMPVTLVDTDGAPYVASGGGGGGGGTASATNQVLEIAALGAPADAEATSGDGTIIAILKNVRTRIASVVTLLGGGLPVALGGGGGLKVDGSGTALPVSGTVTANAGTGTLAVSAAALPLPAGAATAAKQPALGTAGSASTDVLTVQGSASGTPQPVSGTVTSNAGTGTFGTNMAQVAGTTTDTNSGVKSAGTQRFVIATDQPQLTNALKVDGSAVTQPVSGTVTSTPTSYSSPVFGELQGVTSATQLPTVTCKMVQFVAAAANTGKVYLGGSGVTKVDGTTDTTTGLQLSPGQSSGWWPITNLNLLFRICDNTTDHLTYAVMN